MKFKIALLLSLCGFVLLPSGFARAQQVLSLEEAIRIALERNYEIRISSNNLEIDRNNVNRANAGMIPALTGNFSNNHTLQNSRQQRADGQINERNNAKGSNLNYGVSLNWTVFDGFGMFARYDQLKAREQLGEAELQLTIIWEEMLKRFPHIQVVAEPVRTHSVFVKGYETLPVRIPA